VEIAAALSISERDRHQLRDSAKMTWWVVRMTAPLVVFFVLAALAVDRRGHLILQKHPIHSALSSDRG